MAVDDDIPIPPRPLPYWKLALITLPWFSVQFSWSAEFATLTAYMMDLGLSKSLSVLTWMSGPLAGFFVQPMIGFYSDRCTSKYGRRRPFLVGGLLFLVFSQFIYSFGKDIGEWFGDEGCNRTVAVIIGIVSSALMDSSLNVIQTPLRAIVADIAPPSQQNAGQSLASLWNSLGAVSAFLFAAFYDPVEYRKIYFALAYISFGVTATIACYLANETPLSPRMSFSGGQHHASLKEAFTEIYKGVRFMPSGMRRICVVQFCTWAVWFCFLPIWSVWMGEHVYGGQGSDDGGCGDDDDNPEDDELNDLYDEGVSRGSLGQALASAVQFGFSFLVPSLIRYFGIRKTYLMSFAIMVGTFFAMAFLPTVDEAESSKGVSVFLIALTGIPLAATNIFPFSLIGKMFGSDPNVALYMGALNVFIVLPQLLDTMYTGSLAEATNWGWVIFCGACWSVLAFFSIFLLDLPEDDRDDDFEPVHEYQRLDPIDPEDEEKS